MIFTFPIFKSGVFLRVHNVCYYVHPSVQRFDVTEMKILFLKIVVCGV